MATTQFGKASGSKALKATGKIAGFLLGKAVNTLEAAAAIGELAQGKPDGFMAKAVAAAKITVQRLDAKMTMPFASPDADFNGTSLKSAFSSGAKKTPTVQRKVVPVPKASGPKLAPS